MRANAQVRFREEHPDEVRRQRAGEAEGTCKPARGVKQGDGVRRLPPRAPGPIHGTPRRASPTSREREGSRARAWGSLGELRWTSSVRRQSAA